MEMLIAADGPMAWTASMRGEPSPWPDTFEARLAALTLIETLNADLLRHNSATLTLERWCDAHGLGRPARVVAERDRRTDKQPDADQRKILDVPDGEVVRYRRVRLRCGPHVLSEADNWYVPGRITPGMNQTLERTDATFGRVVQPLKFSRQTLLATVLWHPLSDGCDRGAPCSPTVGGSLDMPASILEHRAVLSLPDGTPFSLVAETYTRETLNFPMPLP